ncbi:serine protease 23-like [Montipora foliosa]|uniref:serine protease 23-like n=1 Tax=Montipora foliosa TaxID=591990 RepID=UPI0035F1460F
MFILNMFSVCVFVSKVSGFARLQTHEVLGFRSHCRVKRDISHYSKRFHIPNIVASQKFPFSVAVKLNTGCTGVTVTERHVITAAHCVTSNAASGRKIDKQVQVGFLTPSGNFNWIPVKRTFVPKEWVKRVLPSIKDDFALLVLRKKHNRPFLSPVPVNVSAVVDARSYVYFSAFDDADNSRNLMYRVCQVQGASYGLLYQECSTESGASGAGVYMQVYDLVQDHWDRVLVGIQNTRYSKALSAKELSVTLWFTNEIIDFLCSWTSNSRYSLCSKR